VIGSPKGYLFTFKEGVIDMSLMLINPRKRRAGGRKKPRSAAQKAATRRMLAARSGRASNPAPRRHKRRASARRRHNPIGLSRVVHHRRHTRRRRNPIGLSGGHIGSMVMNGLKGAVGSVAVNAVTSFLPAAVKTGKVLYFTRAGLAILIGTVGRKFLGAHARPMAEGALAVNFADLINSFGATILPGSQLHGVGGEYLGEYLSGSGASTHSLQYTPSHTPEFAMNGVGEYVSY
jgi:hypothetical protein